MHRPGGGSPDPFAVGAAENGFGDDDDFFSQFTPKSQQREVPASEPQAPEEFPSRRSRRRFNPNVYETGPIEDARAGDTGQVPPMFPQHGAAGDPGAAHADEDARDAEERERTAETWQVDPERRRVADEATFTQLIEGLPDDPADHPIESPKYVQDDVVSDDGAQSESAPNAGQQFAPPPPPPAQPEQQQQPEQRKDFAQQQQPEQESPFAPLPEPEVDPQQREQQERANAFFTDAPTENAMPTLPPLEQQAAQQEHSQEPEPEPKTQALEQPQQQQQQPQQPAAQQQQPAQQPDGDDRELSFDGLMAEFDSHESQSARNQETSPASTRDWRASDRRKAQQAATVGAGAGITSGGSGGSGGGTGGGPGDGGPGDGDDPKYSSDEVQRRRKGVMTILIAAAAAVVLIIGAFGINAIFGGGGDSEPSADGQTQSASSDADPSESSPDIGGGLGDGGPTESTPTEEPTTEPFDPVTFQSGSGNIRCQITEETGVACQLTATNFAAPAEMCQNGMYSGASVGVSTDGVTYPCLTGGFGGGEAIGYDTPVTAGPYTCSINYSTGVSCDNGDGDGFSMEYSAGISVTGDVADPAQPEVAPVG